MKYFLSLTLICVCLVIACLGAVAYLLTASGTKKHAQFIMVERGQGVRQIAHTLKNDQFISNEYIFMIGAKIFNRGAPLQAGEYDIPVYASVAQIISAMQSGQVIARRFTIPEGRTSWEIIQILYGIEGLKSTSKTIPIPPEGSLMPDTYHYTKGDTHSDQITHMQQALQNFQTNLDLTTLDKLPLKTLQDVMILASIVEKETAQPDEYNRVAGVFINRLRIGMPLQTDPTIIYGITKGQHKNAGQGPLGRRLLTKDLRADTAYNTYTRRGLPPTPICNPGRAAIMAVLHPQAHDYLYFVADGTGGHAFAKTLADHNRNVTAWRRVR